MSRRHANAVAQYGAPRDRRGGVDRQYRDAHAASARFTDQRVDEGRLSSARRPSDTGHERIAEVRTQGCRQLARVGRLPLEPRQHIGHGTPLSGSEASNERCDLFSRRSHQRLLYELQHRGATSARGSSIGMRDVGRLPLRWRPASSSRRRLWRNTWLLARRLYAAFPRIAATDRRWKVWPPCPVDGRPVGRSAFSARLDRTPLSRIATTDRGIEARSTTSIDHCRIRWPSFTDARLDRPIHLASFPGITPADGRIEGGTTTPIDHGRI